jgi:hypothetical protein
MNLLLICETAIIEQIFSLVCKKLNIDLTITKSNDVNEKYDLIVIDQNFIDDRFNIIKQFSKRLGAISSEELPFDKSRDFIIPRPFLPTKLQDILNEQVEIINEDNISSKAQENKNTSTYIDSNVYNEDQYEEDEDVTVPIITDYVESLAEDVYLDIEEDNDESIVSIASLNNGGILDNSELLKINDILKEDVIHNELVMNKNDWKDISDIIDDALDEVKEYEFDLNEPISNPNPLKLVLSDYNITELKPLLEKFNQNTIDKLSHGESIDIRLVLKEEN